MIYLLTAVEPMGSRRARAQGARARRNFRLGGAKGKVQRDPARRAGAGTRVAGSGAEVRRLGLQTLAAHVCRPQSRAQTPSVEGLGIGEKQARSIFVCNVSLD